MAARAVAGGDVELAVRVVEEEAELNGGVAAGDHAEEDADAGHQAARTLQQVVPRRLNHPTNNTREDRDPPTKTRFCTARLTLRNSPVKSII